MSWEEVVEIERDILSQVSCHMQMGLLCVPCIGTKPFHRREVLEVLSEVTHERESEVFWRHACNTADDPTKLNIGCLLGKDIGLCALIVPFETDFLFRRACEKEGVAKEDLETVWLQYSDRHVYLFHHPCFNLPSKLPLPRWGAEIWSTGQVALLPPSKFRGEEVFWVYPEFPADPEKGVSLKRLPKPIQQEALREIKRRRKVEDPFPVGDE